MATSGNWLHAGSSEVSVSDVLHLFCNLQVLSRPSHYYYYSNVILILSELLLQPVVAGLSGGPPTKGQLAAFALGIIW